MIMHLSLLKQITKVNLLKKEMEDKNEVTNKSFSTFNSFLTKSSLQSIQYIGQFDNKCLIALNNNQQLIIFDQHASAERVGYERLQKISKSQSARKPFTIHPDKIQIKKSNNLDKSCIEILNYFGFTFEEKNNNSDWYYLKTISIFLAIKLKLKRIGFERLKCGIESFKSTDLFNGIPVFIHEILKMLACKEAIKFGQRVETNQAIEIISELSKCDFPFECAHGRPTVSVVAVIQ